MSSKALCALDLMHGCVLSRSQISKLILAYSGDQNLIIAQGCLFAVSILTKQSATSSFYKLSLMISAHACSMALQNLSSNSLFASGLANALRQMADDSVFLSVWALNYSNLRTLFLQLIVTPELISFSTSSLFSN